MPVHKAASRSDLRSALLPTGVEARQVFDDAQRLLSQMISSSSLRGQGLVGFWRAQSHGDDINMYEEDGPVHRDSPVMATFHGLRQQVGPQLCSPVLHSLAWPLALNALSAAG